MDYRRALTEQFYRWERRGRGWHLFDEPVDLEPAFDPFLGHFVHGEIIDDGLRPRWWHRIFAKPASNPIETNPKTVEAYGRSEGDENVIYRVSIPKAYVAAPSSTEHLLTMLALGKQTFGFEVIATNAEATLQFTCKAAGTHWLEAQLKAYFPECSVAREQQDALGALIDNARSLCATDFGLAEEFMRPISRFEGKAYDPYTALFGIIGQLEERETIIVQTLFCGVRHAWAESMAASVTDSQGGSFFHDAPEMPKLAQEKGAFPLVGATVRVVAVAETQRAALRLIGHASLAIAQSSRSTANSLVELPSEGYGLPLRLADIKGRQTHRLGMILNVRELATLAHLPSAHLSGKLLTGSRVTKRAPSYLNDAGYVLGINKHQEQSVSVGLDLAQRTRHMHILGASGVGKSTLLHSLISQDIRNGRGLCCLDPHGDLIENVLNSVPNERIKDVVLIDPSDADHPVGFNVLSAHSDLERELLASDLVALFRRFSTSWGDNLHSVLANAAMAFLYNAEPGHLGDLRKFLIEKSFRERVLATCTDEDLLYYWRVEYPLLKTSSIGSILTRLDAFLRPRVIRNMVCQHRGLDFGSLMDGSKIILVKLSQGLIGTENSHLLGACIVAKLQQCAMARQQQSAHERVPFFCYIDEFHHFVTESMAAILSGIRKFNFGLVLAHQNMQQVHNDEIAGSLTSAGTRICFRLSDADAKRMQDGFNGFGADDFQNLGTGQAIARVNTADAAFNLSVTAAAADCGHRDACIARSRALYSVPISAVTHDTSEPKAEPPPIVPQSQRHIPIAETANPKQSYSQEHRYLQNFIKAMAEQHGYRANIEVPTADSSGMVDVELVKGNERIAVEISVTTPAEWELHNVQKCLSESYNRVVVCSANRAKLSGIKQKITGAIPESDWGRIALISPEEIPTLFSLPEKREENPVSTMKGYRIKVKYDSDASGPARAEVIRRIVNGGKRP